MPANIPPDSREALLNSVREVLERFLRIEAAIEVLKLSIAESLASSPGAGSELTRSLFLEEIEKAQHLIVEAKREQIDQQIETLRRILRDAIGPVGPRPPF